MRLDEISQTFVEVTTSRSVIRLFYSGIESLYFTAASEYFCSSNECLSSGESMSSKEKF